MIAVQGPNARSKIWDALPGSKELTECLVPFSAVEMGTMFIARTGYTGEDGFEMIIPAKAAPFFWATLAEKGVKPIGLGARDTLRLEAGMDLYGQDMDESVNPLEAGLAWTVFTGIERADSVVIDFHKMLLVPALNTLVMFRNGERSFETFAQKASYLFQKSQNNVWYNSAIRTIECTKSALGIIAYTAMKYYRR